jgi:hypothetical protein
MMSLKFAERPTLRRRVMALEALRMLVNHELGMHTECFAIHIRRIVVTEPDATGCNWQVEWPIVRAADIEPCRSQLRELVDQLRERYNVER